MPLSLDLSLAKRFLPPVAEDSRARAAFLRLEEAEEKGLPVGWRNLANDYDKEEFARILSAAKRIRESCQVFIVIGIGGSYLGARAAIEFLYGQNYNLRTDAPQIFFAGNSLDPDAAAALFEYCKTRSVCINVISKSGTTTEPAVAFRLWRTFLEEKYGVEEARQRIFVTTDRANKPGTLKELAQEEGYESFVVPDDIGGRYSVLSAVGLLPIAVSGANLEAMLSGAREGIDRFGAYAPENPAVQYALCRNALYEGGKTVELFASFSPALQYMGEWLKQLFGESEGKEQKALFPASVIYSTDLHSMGQYVQQGARVFFETFLEIASPESTLSVPMDEKNVDKLNFLAGKTLGEVNDKALQGTLAAHAEGDVPIVQVKLARADEEHFGLMVMFFETACAISGYLLGVNPFDQPGVELYKGNMFRLLGKPGYENKSL